MALIATYDTQRMINHALTIWKPKLILFNLFLAIWQVLLMIDLGRSE